MRSRIAARMFETEEVLVAAAQLVGLPGITTAPPQAVTYLHLLFDRHEVVFANGAPSESLYPGPVALKSRGARGRWRRFSNCFPIWRNATVSACIRPGPWCAGGRAATWRNAI